MWKRKLLLAAGVIGALGIIGGASAWLLWPQPENWTEEAKLCIGDKYAGFWEASGQYSFRMEFENNCYRKIACGLDVMVSNARGTVKDHGTVTIPARGEMPGAAVYSLPTTSSSGMAQTARNCRFV
ncbi:hypothetical protein E0H22_12010 [Rhodopseudomonas boonkerdii]|uniref:hypothetical protein n=1 Tax=Rhodopseudomonas boonkerdii TaxID=475937 RepID=UPI001E495D1B|nr:hypothetical protein [Rhodopseudomonas boonkerdii]UGV26351.1 hypothetical protein E0H22_12010 [Rhodopseudomonas boonkerdii]